MPIDLARRASLAEMKGLLFKSIPGEDPVKPRGTSRTTSIAGRKRKACNTDHMLGRLRLRPANGASSAKTVREMIDRGVKRDLVAGV